MLRSKGTEAGKQRWWWAKDVDPRRVGDADWTGQDSRGIDLLLAAVGPVGCVLRKRRLIARWSD